MTHPHITRKGDNIDFPDHRQPNWGVALMANYFYADDDKLSAIPKGQRNAALGMWVMAASWCMEQRTGGYVPAHMLAEWGDDHVALAACLVDAGLWASMSGDEEGYLFVDPWVVDPWLAGRG